jgi:hypothetical protein
LGKEVILTVPPYLQTPTPPDSFHSWYPFKQRMQSTTLLDEPPYNHTKKTPKSH